VTGEALKAVVFATSQVGVPYVYGGTSPKGFDCSGLVQWAYRKAGVSIPRTSEAQLAGLPVATGNLKVGDLLFPHPGHVVMYLGGGQVVEAPHTGALVKIRKMTEGDRAAGVRRPDPNSPPDTGATYTLKESSAVLAGGGGTALNDALSGVQNLLKTLLSIDTWKRVALVLLGAALFALAVRSLL